jgi:hypothetical protein
MLKMNLITQEELWGELYGEVDGKLSVGLYREVGWELYRELCWELWGELYWVLGSQILTDFRGYNTVCYK